MRTRHKIGRQQKEGQPESLNLRQKEEGKMKEVKFRGKRVDNGAWVYGVPYAEYVNHPTPKGGGLQKP